MLNLLHLIGNLKRIFSIYWFYRVKGQVIIAFEIRIYGAAEDFADKIVGFSIISINKRT